MCVELPFGWWGPRRKKEHYLNNKHHKAARNQNSRVRVGDAEAGPMTGLSALFWSVRPGLCWRKLDEVHRRISYTVERVRRLNTIARDGLVGADAAALGDDDDDEDELDQQDAFEAQYNFRFEEPGSERIVPHPRMQVESTRPLPLPPCWAQACGHASHTRCARSFIGPSSHSAPGSSHGAPH